MKSFHHVMCGVLLAVCGCSSRSESQQDERTERNQHEVTRTVKQVPVPTADGGHALVTVIETTERWLDDQEQARTETSTQGKSGPDLEAIAKAASVVPQMVPGPGSGTGLLATGTGLATMALAWGARELLARRDQSRTVSESDRKAKEERELYEQRIARLREDRDAARDEALKLAKKLPPEQA